MNASKWLKTQVLLDEKEMQDLLNFLAPFYLCDTSQVVEKDRAVLAQTEFLATYGDYVRSLREQKKASPRLRSLSMSTSLEDFQLREVRKDGYLMKPIRPVIQIQSHDFCFSEDGTLLSMIKREDAIRFGIQFSFPTLFQDPSTQSIIHVMKENTFPNSHLYKNIMKWTRSNTKPFSHIFKGKKKILPIRLGLQCFSWIDNHPDLQKNFYKD